MCFWMPAGQGGALEPAREIRLGMRALLRVNWHSQHLAISGLPESAAIVPAETGISARLVDDM